MMIRRLLFFNIGFWLLAAAVMFLGSWPGALGHLDVAIVRSLYFMLIGFLVTFAIRIFYSGPYFQRSKQRLLLIVLTCAGTAILTAILLNPVTYLMAGFEIQAVPHEILSTGTLYFVLLYIIWSALYLQSNGQSILRPEMQESPLPGLVFTVDKLGDKRKLHDRDICCVIASGNYVELVTPNNSYLVKDTLARLEDRLDEDRFKRVHRSIIVNSAKVENVVLKPGGAYEIKLEGGQLIRSSRSYKAVVEGILPAA